MRKNLIRAGIGMIVAMSATAASAACYHVYNGRGQLVERSPGPPVNMSLHLRQTVPVKYGRGATMVFEAPAGTSCTDFYPAHCTPQPVDSGQRGHSRQSGAAEYRSARADGRSKRPLAGGCEVLKGGLCAACNRTGFPCVHVMCDNTKLRGKYVRRAGTAPAVFFEGDP